MRVLLRPITTADVPVCGRICYEAFSGAAAQHGFPVDWRSEDMAVKVIEARVAHALSYGVVAQVEGRVVGSAFLKEYRPFGPIGPVTVSPRVQGGGVGRMMMEHLLERGRALGLAGTRLVQAAYNPLSLSLYVRLGFEVREFLVCLHGNPIASRFRGYAVYAGDKEDLAACNALCLRFHGYSRDEDLIEALSLRSLTVVQHGGRITGYSTGAHFRGHTVAETNEDAQALIAGAETLPEPGMLMPASNGALLRWALANGLRMVQPLSLMSTGPYRQPGGVFLPSIHG